MKRKSRSDLLNTPNPTGDGDGICHFPLSLVNIFGHFGELALDRAEIAAIICDNEVKVCYLLYLLT